MAWPPVCGCCGITGASLRCSRCKNVHYCTKDCQRKHWNVHEACCRKMQIEVDHGGQDGHGERCSAQTSVARASGLEKTKLSVKTGDAKQQILAALARMQATRKAATALQEQGALNRLQTVTDLMHLGFWASAVQQCMGTIEVDTFPAEAYLRGAFCLCELRQWDRANSMLSIGQLKLKEVGELTTWTELVSAIKSMIMVELSACAYQ
eukprot:TRINITY_DN72575_c0_g1_i3.p1 TRINITY_DN72575_c0_g1~~TRINITY_DN72575_c0_g1_i3.p1  ORF type:complete len:208 (+),score=5.01 TRINITY_DN72575_c0_g1_i3:54-677(+)